MRGGVFSAPKDANAALLDFFGELCKFRIESPSLLPGFSIWLVAIWPTTDDHLSPVRNE